MDGGLTPTGAVNRPINEKLAEFVSVLDFGADPTGVADSHTAFANAIATGKDIYAPKGTYLINSSIDCTTTFSLFGDGKGATFIHRNYSPTVNTDGIFTIKQGGTLISMRDMTLRSLSGQTGGCLLSIVATASGMGLYSFTNMDFTTTGSSTHNYTLYFDGTASSSAPIGLRGIDIVGCDVFGGAISTMLIKGVLKFSFVGGGVYTAGGAVGSNINFDGTLAVPTQSFVFTPSDCSCPISFDYAQLGIFGCGIMGAVTNTANTENIYGYGFCGSLQQNWGNSMFFDTSEGLKLTQNQKISNKGAAANFAIEMIGAVTGYKKDGSVTTIGQVGVGYSTVCPNAKNFSFVNQSGKLFTISTGGGASALVFAEYKSSTITLLANPSNEFQASSTPGAGFTGIAKSINSHTITIYNNTGSSTTYDILNVGNVSSTTDPV